MSKKTDRLLSTATKRLGLPLLHTKKPTVVAAAAAALGRVVPNKEAWPALLREYVLATGPVESGAETRTRTHYRPAISYKRDSAARPSTSAALPYEATDAFLSSYEWRKLRMVVLKASTGRCGCCGASPSDGVTVLNVDHIKPRRLFPALALAQSNLQVLCDACNHGKGNWDQTDWRTSQQEDETKCDV